MSTLAHQCRDIARAWQGCFGWKVTQITSSLVAFCSSTLFDPAPCFNSEEGKNFQSKYWGTALSEQYLIYRTKQYWTFRERRQCNGKVANCRSRKRRSNMKCCWPTVRTSRSHFNFCSQFVYIDKHKDNTPTFSQECFELILGKCFENLEGKKCKTAINCYYSSFTFQKGHLQCVHSLLTSVFLLFMCLTTITTIALNCQG